MNKLFRGCTDWIQKHPRWTITLSSLLWAFAYPPFPLGWLSFVVLVPAFVATSGLRPRQAFGSWFVGGLAYNLVMYWWIYNVMKVGPVFAVGGGLVLLILFLSLFNGLIGLGFRLSLKRPLLFFTYPLAWAGLEAARAVGEMSFPWNNFGYTLGHHLQWIQSASWFGIYGLSAILIVVNLILFHAWRTNSNRTLWLLAGLCIPAAMFLHGAMALKHDASDASTVTISLVQPSIPQTKKWSEEYFGDVISKTFRTMDGVQGDFAPVKGSDLVVLAETAVPDFLFQTTRSGAYIHKTLIDSFATRAREWNTPILLGALHYLPDHKPWRDFIFYNSAFLFRPEDGNLIQQYSKLRLVPFSEKLPFQNVFPILNYVHLGEGDFTPGNGYRIWNARGDSLPYAPSICYEIIYPSFVREAKAAGAQFIVNITNDGWFGRSNGPYEHANIARFRAVESGMPIARCSNTGVSVFYDAWGRDLGYTELMDSTVLQRRLPVPHRNTFYARHGGFIDGFFLTVLGIWILASLLL